MDRLLYVAAGGALGAVCRYSVGLACLSLLGERFPYATLIVNVAGCFALGMLAQEGVAHALRLSAAVHPGITVGFLGALTTFSTFGYETVRLAELREWRLVVLSVLGNVVLGCLAAGAGILAARALAGGPGEL